MSALESLQVGSALSYLIALVIPALDAIFPVLPSETVIIALGTATAGSVDPRIALLVGCAAVGAFLGDNLCYLFGSRFGPAVQRRFFATPKGMKARAWAERSLERFGMQLIIVCRFIPGGRTAVTLTCGLTGYPRRRFTIATAVAAVIWALYSFLIGRIGGRAFEDNLWAGFVVAFSASIAISAVIEVVRRLRAHIRRRASAAAAPPSSQRHAGQVEPDHAGQDQGNRDEIDRRDPIAEEDDADRRPHGANPGPDRVGGPDHQLAQSYGQQPQMETVSIGSSRGTDRPCIPAGEPEFREPRRTRGNLRC
jgi:membrane-associated protein